MLKDLFLNIMLLALFLSTNFASAQIEPSEFDATLEFIQRGENSIDFERNSGNALYQLDSLYFEGADEIDNTIWLPKLYYLYDYDDAGRIERESMYYWATNMESWLFVEEELFEYDANNFCVRREKFVLDFLSNEFIPSTTSVFDLTETGLVREELITKYDEELQEILPHFRSTFTLDDAGLTQEWLWEEWNQADQLWQPLSLAENTFNDLDQLIESSSSSFESGIGDWVITKRFENSYDDNGNLIERVRISINGSTETATSIAQYNFDESSTLLSSKLDLWDGENWIPFNEFAYHQDHSVVLEELQLPWFHDNDQEFNRKLELKEEFSFNNGMAELDFRSHYFYNEIMGVNGVTEQQFETIAYPNPASDQLFFELPEGWQEAKLTIVSATGQVVFSDSIVGDQPISLHKLIPGNYFYRISSNEKVTKGQFLKN